MGLWTDRLSSDDLKAFDDALGACIGAEVEGVLIAKGSELFQGDGAAPAVMAVEKDWLALVCHAARERGFDLINGEVDGLGQVALVEFSGGSDIDNESALAQAFMCIISWNLARPPERDVGQSEDGNKGDESPFHPFRLTP